jgi:hypothetical protein
VFRQLEDSYVHKYLKRVGALSNSGLVAMAHRTAADPKTLK